MIDMPSDGVKDIDPRPLTREGQWVREILQTSADWSDADISRTKVIAEGPCDEGVSIRLQAPEAETRHPQAQAGYIGRIVIINADDSLIEIRLTHSRGSLDELFVLFVDPKDPHRKLPENWTEVSHEAFAL